jgi:hypothetical protein
MKPFDLVVVDSGFGGRTLCSTFRRAPVDHG